MISAFSGPSGCPWSRDPLDDGLQYFGHPEAGLLAEHRIAFRRRYQSRPRSRCARCRVRGRQIDLVEDRHHLRFLFDRGVAVGNRLRLYLRGIDDQQRTFHTRPASGRPSYEVDASRRIDQVEVVDPGRRAPCNGARLSAPLMVMRAFAFEIHRSSTCASISRSERPPQN